MSSVLVKINTISILFQPGWSDYLLDWFHSCSCVLGSADSITSSDPDDRDRRLTLKDSSSLSSI